MWSTRLLRATELQALGAGIHVVSAHELDDEVAQIAASIATYDAELVRATKAALNEAASLGPIPGYVAEQKYTALLAASANDQS
jgi:enoyl-CoA hydratase/carnithine racemase